MNVSPIKIEQDVKYPSMYWLVWEDGIRSETFYNKTRATEYLKNYTFYLNNLEHGEKLSIYNTRLIDLN